MSSVIDHYDNHLASIYVWMAGGLEAAIARGRAEIEAAFPRPGAAQCAIDLGAGFGMHAIPLADIGYSVTAIDSSGTLLEVIKNRVSPTPITTVQNDLLSFKKHLKVRPALVICMGDTLTHLPDPQSVEQLFEDVADALIYGGTFIVSFRDYSIPLIGEKRFIPVRSDPDRILTCFLEYENEAVTVHDILHERDGAQWQQRVSAYRKLRLSPDWVILALEAKGLQVTQEQGASGMVRLVAKRPL